MKQVTHALLALLVAAVVLSGCALTPAAQPSATPQAAIVESGAASPSLAKATTETTAAATAGSAAQPAASATPAPAAVQPGIAPATTAAAVSSSTTTSSAAATVTSAAAVDPSLASTEAAFQAIFARVNPSVVMIEVVVAASSLQSNPFFGGSQPQEGLGSGFVWDTEGHIVTNNHVVEGATTISVKFFDGTTVPATLVGADPDSDLAVIKIDGPAEYLKPVTRTDSTKVKVGQWAIAIGNPFGEQNTMTAGIVSALGRSLPVSSESTTGGYVIPDVIQTDAPINPGNSGGVLLDSQGRLIGVTTAIQSSTNSSAGIGFAVPSIIVERVVPALIKTGQYDQTWLGITGGDLTSDMAVAMGLPKTQRGALVSDVVAGGPAAKAGVKGSAKTATISGQQVPIGGDVIVAVDGSPVKSFSDVVAFLARYTDVGQTITMTVLRDGKEQQIKITLQARPSSLATAPTAGQAAGAGAYLGVSGLSVTADIAKAMDLPTSVRGVLVQQVTTGSPADEGGLRASTTPVAINGATVMVGGDIIIGFSNRSVSSLDDLTSFLQQSSAGDMVTLTIVRDGRQGRVRLVLADQPTTALPLA